MRVVWCLMALAASCMAASIPGLGPPSTPENMAQPHGVTHQTPLYPPSPLQQASRGARLDLAPMSALTSAMQLFNTFSGSTSNSGTAKSDEIPNAVFGQAAKQMLKTVAKKRVGRFLDGLFGDDQDGGTGYNTPVSGIPNPIGDLVGRIFPFNLDTDEVMRGFLKPENVAVHVAQEPATGYSISESTHPFASASAANEVRSGKLSSSTNAREQPETSLEEAEQAIAEEKEKMKQTERLYELQVQEYRRRKKMEALKRKMELQAAAASEHISSTAAATAEDRQFIASSSYEEDLAAPPPQPELTQSQMQAKVETYQKYLQKKQNQMLQRRHSDDSIEYIVSHEAASQLAPMSVQVKSKGAGGPMRRKRKVKKHSSIST